MTMPFTRRKLLAAGGVGLASTQVAGRARADLEPTMVDGLARASAEGNAALMRGDAGRYRDLIPLTDDFTLMTPFGGPPRRGPIRSEEEWRDIGRFFENGTLEQEVIAAYGSADMAALVVIERAHVEVGGLPAQDWSLRVTLVYRREGGAWRLAHRHADPLAPGVSLKEAAALARGDGVEPRPNEPT